MIRLMKQLALIGPTASGKTALALRLAEALDALILSLDSLAIYRKIDIASAKPTVEERREIPHYGIDIIDVDEPFDVTSFIDLYKRVHTLAAESHKGLIIVGGTSFYLKSLLNGISARPTLTEEMQQEVSEIMRDLTRAYTMLQHADPLYMQQIMPQDSYRIEKALEIYIATGQTPSRYFQDHPPLPIIAGTLPLYEIVIERPLLRERIRLRTERMLEEGIIDEVALLERSYGRLPHPMKAIGIKETLGYLDGLYHKSELVEKISTNTARLAKRQESFNRSQFEKRFQGSAEEIYKEILFQ